MVKVGIIRNVKTLVDETLYTKVGSVLAALCYIKCMKSLCLQNFTSWKVLQRFPQILSQEDT